MLRFVQGIHKAFRSNQAYAPCQKAAHDQDEFDTRVGDCLPQRRSFNGLAAAVPLSQPLSSSSLTDIPAESAASDEGEQTASKGYHSAGYTQGLLPGAVLGTGIALFNSVHAYCSGRGANNAKSKSKYCPVAQYQQLQRSSLLVRTLGGLAWGYDVSPGFSVNHKRSDGLASRPIHSRNDDTLSLSESVDDDEAQRQKEFEKAQEEVTAMADKLGSLDKDNLAADHFLAMRAWKCKDFVAAAGLWQRTVDKFATPIAAHRLGIIFENGHGVTRDYQQASEYYNLAISHQCSRAMYKQAMLQISGLVEGDTDSMELMEQSAELNYSKAQTFLGTVNFHKGNKELAVEYYQKAAAQDDADALYYLGICHEVGEGLPAADDVQAAECYTKAAEGGQADAQFNLAMFYEEGLGDLEQDKEKCVYWLNRSAKQGTKLAKSRLMELGRWNLAPSASLPAIGEHLPSTLSDLAVTEMVRAHSANSLPNRQTHSTVTPITTHTAGKTFSRASSSSSIAGTPQFYVPTGGDDESDVSSFGEWSDEGLSSASSTSLQLDKRNDQFSVTFSLENTSYNKDLHPKLYSRDDSWGSVSVSSLYRPEHEGPQITFA